MLLSLALASEISEISHWKIFFFFLYHHSIITYGVRFQDRKGSLRCLLRAEIADFLNRKGAFTLSALDLKSSGRGGRLDAD